MVEATPPDRYHEPHDGVGQHDGRQGLDEELASQAGAAAEGRGGRLQTPYGFAQAPGKWSRKINMSNMSMTPSGLKSRRWL